MVQVQNYSVNRITCLHETPSPLTLYAFYCVAVTGSSSITPSHWRSPPVEESSQLTTTDNSGNSGTNNPPPPPPSPLPPPLLPASAKVPSQPPSAPASLPGSPKRSTHVLTHLVEGFVIKEGLEPFPVCGCALCRKFTAD